MPIKVIDAKSDRIPFSCIIDGNEAIYAWRISCRLIDDYSFVFDTGRIVLEAPFFPIDEKNRNIIFEKDIKSYLIDSESGNLKTIAVYKPCTENGFVSGATYYTRDTSTIPYSYTVKSVSGNSNATNYYEKIWHTLYYKINSNSEKTILLVVKINLAKI